MASAYKKLVDELGEEAAKAEMRRRRAMVKNPYHGFANMPTEKVKELSRKGLEKRWTNTSSTTKS